MKTVLITGAGGNLGAAAVERFATDGFQVIALVSPGKIPMGKKPNVDYFEADLVQESQVENLMVRLSKSYSTMDGVILTVGGFEAGGIETADEASLHRMYTLNFETAYNCARPLFRYMSAQPSGGRIIFIGAKPALEAKAGSKLIAYGLSKSLLFKLAEYFNAASETVKSHVIVFGSLDTPQNRKAMPDANTAGWVKPEKVAERMVEILKGTGTETVVRIGP